MGMPFKKLPVLFSLAMLACLALPGISLAEPGPPSELEALYKQALQNKGRSVFGKPLFVSSSIQENRFSADVFGIVEHPFPQITKELTIPANWCRFVPLNFNVKACTYHSQNNQPSLTFYAGRKFYEAPDNAYRLHYQYKVANIGSDYLRVLLSAESGPMGTEDYRIELDAIPVDDKTFLRIHSSYSSSFLSRLATDVYLSTLGSDKVGFSVVDTTDTGEPIYISGVKGIVERNAMRYYLALQAFLDTSRLPPEDRFEARIKTWFDLSETYATQLHELERNEYLESKRKEHLNQIELQRKLDGNGGSTNHWHQ